MTSRYVNNPLFDCTFNYLVLQSHNILLDDKWNARISDFGITRLKENNNKNAKESKNLGTIYWSAPELLAGEAITEKIDCYSFGIVLWEIFHR